VHRFDSLNVFVRAGRQDWANFRPNWGLYTLGRFLKIAIGPQNFGLLFSMIQRNYALNVTKMGLATFGAIFSQTRLVTLVIEQLNQQRSPTHLSRF
jgi:hypothetical protein